MDYMHIPFYYLTYFQQNVIDINFFVNSNYNQHNIPFPIKIYARFPYGK